MEANKQLSIVYQPYQVNRNFGLPIDRCPHWPRSYFPAWRVDAKDLQTVYAWTQQDYDLDGRIAKGDVAKLRNAATSISVGDVVSVVHGSVVDSCEYWLCTDFDWEEIFLPPEWSDRLQRELADFWQFCIARAIRGNC